MKMISYLVALLICVSSCNNDDDNAVLVTDNSTPPDVLGMTYSKSDQSFEETYTTLKNALEANNNITIFAEVDHQANASSVGQTLNPTKVIFFGNPQLGTVLMQENQQSGLDLPQRILVYQDANEDVYVAFNDATYLAERHSLNEESTLDTIENALTNFTTTASGSVVVPATQESISADYNVISLQSNETFEQTYSQSY